MNVTGAVDNSWNYRNNTKTSCCFKYFRFVFNK